MAAIDSYAGPRTSDDNRNNTNWGGQTFTASQSYTITSVKLTLSRLNSPGTVTVSIRACTTDVPSTALPTGTDLTSGTINGDDLTTSPVLTEITLTPYALTSGKMYAIVIRGTGSSTNYVKPAIDGTPEYSGGRYCQSADSGASWAAIAYDMLFETYGATVHQCIAACSGSGSGTFVLTGDFLLTAALSGLGTLISSLNSTVLMVAALTGTGSLSSFLVKLFKFDRTAPKSRLVVAASNQIWYEDI